MMMAKAPLPVEVKKVPEGQSKASSVTAWAAVLIAVLTFGDTLSSRYYGNKAAERAEHAAQLVAEVKADATKTAVVTLDTNDKVNGQYTSHLRTIALLARTIAEDRSDSPRAQEAAEIAEKALADHLKEQKK